MPKTDNDGVWYIIVILWGGNPALVHTLRMPQVAHFGEHVLNKQPMAYLWAADTETTTQRQLEYLWQHNIPACAFRTKNEMGDHLQHLEQLYTNRS